MHVGSEYFNCSGLSLSEFGHVRARCCQGKGTEMLAVSVGVLIM